MARRRRGGRRAPAVRHQDARRGRPVRPDRDRPTNAGAEASDISCPGDVEVQKGHTFTCTATVDGQQVTYQVTQTDDEGKVEVKADGHTTLVVTGSTDLRCTVTNAGDATDSVDVTATIDGDGNVGVTYDR